MSLFLIDGQDISCVNSGRMFPKKFEDFGFYLRTLRYPT